MPLHRHDGFTLIEVLAVLAIMAIAAAITIPVLDRPLADARLYTDARQMTQVLRSARQQAITSGKAVTVIFYPTSARYRVLGETPTNLQKDIRFVGSTTFTTKYGSLPTCAFDPSGTPGSGGTVTLSNGQRLLYVIVNPVAGRVRLSETPPDGW
ncbi:MAG: prepilin-type N-terminal cleavage/methylation domain-containing protein [Syntrophomonadaceae bacterium]|nr:prepilin-type N-terminal cleavage/methylation domain-containing protein [Syntrophomonadaceae bacterium]